MRISINISTEKELVYPENGTGSPVLLNKEDGKKMNENFNYSFGGLNLDGSIQPLVDLILEWVKKQS
jgi:hypothetical protein